jgi:hypothetical protein
MVFEISKISKSYQKLLGEMKSMCYWVVGSNPPGPSLSVVQLRYCSELILVVGGQIQQQCTAVVQQL